MICKDNIRADIKVKFFVRVNKSVDDVLRVAQAIGCERASHQETLDNLFSAKFSEALKTVGKAMDFVDLYQARDHFRDEIIRQIGQDLSGYHLEDAAIDYIEQTPLEKLDPQNILDAQGIKKITQLTARDVMRSDFGIVPALFSLQNALITLDRYDCAALPVIEPDGGFRNYYCNINMPPTFENGVLDYIDLDIDVLVWKDAVYEVVDRDDFEANVLKYGYPDSIREKVEETLVHLIGEIKAQNFPFNHQP